MVKRRQFIGALSALGGSVLLSACGGGGSDSSDNAASATARNATATAKAASGNGTAMPPASSLIDGSGNTWTLSGGSVYKNGVIAGNNYNVAVAMCFNGNIFVENTSGQWFQWDGLRWEGCMDPRVRMTSPNGTTMPSASSIIDWTGGTWTLSNGVIYLNGVVVGLNYNVTLVLWYGGQIYCCNTSGQWYVNVDSRNFSAQWLPCNDPRIAVASVAGNFYGINGHYDYTYTPAQLVSLLKGLGCSIYRVGCGSDSRSLSAVVNIAKAFQSAGLSLLVLIEAGVYDANGNVFANEAQAYQTCFATAQTIATALQPYGVTMYECGNELTRQPATVLDFHLAGSLAGDFNNTNWPAMRGSMRGMIDGVKSVQPSAKCGVNFCVADIGAADALWEGTQPDGSSGHQKLRWDITTWHNYEAYGDIFDISPDGAGPGFDLPTYCKARYGVPFMITEWNCGPDASQTYRADYVNTQLGQFYPARKTHNIQSVMYYVLDSGNTSYGIVINGTPNSAPYNAFASFAANNPDN
ncbi:hypothetical protein [Paraburkholderia sp. CI3]|uniref:hypothetical protein n=1 Tax=Paraburkholderia sp. CI3 TaxID=2991060 RepID=UPI003D22F46F